MAVSTLNTSSPTIPLPPIELLTDDGEPLASEWHRAQINLLIDALRTHWTGRKDFFTGGNMFVYYSTEQARRRDYRGPDFFVVLGVEGSVSREA
jgi:Uma2 family endonuclease